MPDVDKALADIVAIRAQIARNTAFRGYGPATIAATGILALLVAGGQALWLDGPTDRPLAFFGVWIATAVVAAVFIGVETVTRSRRLHSDLADEMIQAAIEQFLPAGAAGALMALVIFRFAPESLWLLPGLWQVFVGLGIFAARASLPPAVVYAGGWYLVSGLACVALAADGHGLSPWAMGIPFGIGQLLLAFILRRALGDADAQA